MEFFLEFISRLISSFFIAYIVYIILGRNDKIPKIILIVMILYGMVRWVGYLRAGFATDVIILMFAISVLPSIFAFLLFMKMTGGFVSTRIRFKRSRVKISHDVITIYKDQVMMMVSILAATAFAVLAYFFLEDIIKYVILAFAGVLGAIGVLFIHKNRKINHEKVIVFVGKNKEYVYAYDIQKKKMKITVEDFFSNPDYIVDPIGIIYLALGNQTIEKHYLYWIATSENINMEKEQLNPIENIPYGDYLKEFQKYHYQIAYFEVDGLGKCNLTKKKIVK